jgi:hypothetical protein
MKPLLGTTDDWRRSRWHQMAATQLTWFASRRGRPARLSRSKAAIVENRDRRFSIRRWLFWLFFLRSPILQHLGGVLDAKRRADRKQRAL